MASRRRSYTLVYDVEVRHHLAAIHRRHHSLIRKTIEDQLQFQPNVETRNRKPLTRPTRLAADWELRFGPENCFRVFYRTDRRRHTVYVLAVGFKRHNLLYIGGEEFEL